MSPAARELAVIFCDYLPGSGSSQWQGHVSFKTVADKVGVGDFWQPGSKLPMITALIERTLESRRDRFEPLILEIIRCGLTYRQKSGRPVTAEDINSINGLILEIGFKFPDLWDNDFIASLSVNGSQRAARHVERMQAEERLRESRISQRSSELEKLKKEFFALHDNPDRRAAGLQLERVLTRLFEVNNLCPREPFRVVGEQIDGSFELDYEVYLLEAKWQHDPIPASDLYVFREKIEGKSKFTRGVFLSISGISPQALEAITHGKQPNFFIADGYDLMMILEANIELGEFFRRRQRLFAEAGRVCVPFSELTQL